MIRILIVEDEVHLARGLQFNLEAEGYTVELTDNGEAALTKLLCDHAPFDALILDVMLPGQGWVHGRKRIASREAVHPPADADGTKPP